jgi:uncharacterized protein
MKTKLFLTMAVLAALAVAGLVGCSNGDAAAADIPAVSVNVNNQQGIWVSGVGKVTIIPDIANVSLGVSAQASKVTDAQSQAAIAMDKVMAALTGKGIDKKDIQTQYYSIQPNYKYDNTSGQSTISGYSVSNTVNVKIKNVDSTGVVIDAVVAAGGDNTRINGISFSVEKPELSYAQARKAAMEDAKAKAEDLAKLANVTLGKATYVSESTATSPIPYPVYRGADMASAAPDTAISPGETDIVLNVQVAYAIQ